MRFSGSHTGKYPLGHLREEVTVKPRTGILGMNRDARWSGNHTIAQEIREPVTRTVGLPMLQPHL